MTNNNEQQNNNNQSQPLWTTWEDLLLSCAVKRYGFSDWSTVATELQSRVDNNLFTAQICADKFRDLKIRFAGENISGDGENVGDVPWLDELRNLRIKELKEIVQGRGVSIQSLNLKVKRLEEERERSEKEDGESDRDKPDLEAERSENDKNGEDDVVLAEKDDNVGDVVGDSVSGDRENRSVNESNSTEKKMMETEPVRTGGNESGGEKDKSVEPVQAVEADSWNDSSKPSEEKKPENESVKVVESAGGESKGAKDSNEAQSSASLTRKSRSSNSNSGGGDGGGGNEQMVSKTTSRDSGKNSEHMNRVLETIRLSTNGSVFEARLQSQKTEMYNSIIRQHVDLETVQSRVTNGSYSLGTMKFYLDLLLIFNNAIVFYSKSSPESVAAVELRKFVLKGLNKKRSAKKSNPSPDSAPTTLHKSDPERSDSLLAKQKNSAPFIVCRKRSSITSKPSASNKAQKPDDKQVLDTKQPPARPSSSSPNEEESLLKLTPKEKPVTGARSMRRSGSARINNATNASAKNTTVKTPMTSPTSNPGSSTIKVAEAPKADNKKKTNPLLMKKREAADFLKRIKKSSPAKGTLLDTLKSLPENSNSSSKREAREAPKKKVDERKESTRGRQKGRGGGKRAKEEEASQSKRNVGRPPKRGREEGAATGKRGKEVVEEEVVAKRPSKRGKR